MAPSAFKKIGAAVACATAVRAATESYQLSEEYTVDNFFDKFDFFTSTYTSGDSWDDTHGYVQYRGQADAESLGLISTSTGGIYIGPDTNSTYDPDGKGRDSVRITSKAMYNEGLMIAKFSHMPVQACGAWPAFWSFGSPWLTMGEIDYFEGWNMMEYNRMAMHTNETIAGECALTTTGIDGTVMTSNCNNEEDGTGCGVKDDSGVWSSTTGATFAMEWTDSAIKIWSWLPSAVPSDITAGTPDPSSSAWGNPTLLVEQTNCDLSKSFANQQLVFNIDFCGDTAGSPTFWNETCSAQVGDTCANYVANNPSAFAETYFMIEGIQYYELGVATASVTASASLVSPTTTSAAIAGLLSGAGSVLESTLDATPTSAPNAAVTEAVQPYQHTTSYIYGTSTSTDEFGSETTVVVVVDTTICPVTAAEASQSSVLASESSVAVAAETTPASQPAASATNVPAASPTPHTTITSYSTSTSQKLTTSTILITSSSTITSCASTASASCSVGDITEVIKVSTTICPVTAAEASASRKASSIVASASSGFSVPAPSGSATTENSPVEATASSRLSLSASVSKSTVYSTRKTTLTAAAAASSTPSSSSSKASTTSAQGTTEVISATETGGGLEVATGTPTSISLEWMTQATAAASAAAYNGGNGTITSSSASATQTDNCSGLDCIVVSSSGSKNGIIGAGGLALAAFAGAIVMF
ncbi:hypothetical protein N0V93_008512 [Gnomoniopsis smithogilvyi]|uniref:GH16 domain-containing protein n=1 Tax=Gnomoniopsis smithogilvyi TaxID=1191159 RepID=A0A9W8YLV0_9PEZI|nr:hypothetical protein N0V93_008512 [Gnomoniopsis smithogilvyi]